MLLVFNEMSSSGSMPYGIVKFSGEDAVPDWVRALVSDPSERQDLDDDELKELKELIESGAARVVKGVRYARASSSVVKTIFKHKKGAGAKDSGSSTSSKAVAGGKAGGKAAGGKAAGGKAAGGGKGKPTAKDPNRVKKPPSAYLLFCGDVRTQVKNELMEEHGSEFKNEMIMKKTGEMWKALTEDMKEPYKARADKAKEEAKEAVMKGAKEEEE